MRTLGAGELTTNQLSELIQVRFKLFFFYIALFLTFPSRHKAGEKYAREIWSSLDAKLENGDKNLKSSKGKAKERMRS